LSALVSSLFWNSGRNWEFSGCDLSNVWHRPLISQHLCNVKRRSAGSVGTVPATSYGHGQHTFSDRRQVCNLFRMRDEHTSSNTGHGAPPRWRPTGLERGITFGCGLRHVPR
jgi:hypothetical protein